MNSKFLALCTALLISPIVFSQSAQANETKCKFASNCVYGPSVSDRWEKGNQAQQKGDFKNAQVFFTRAMNASEQLTISGKSAEQTKLLRACASMGSYARLQGAIVGGEFMDSHNMTKQSIDMALDVARKEFRDVSDAQEIEFPELANKCP